MEFEMNHSRQLVLAGGPGHLAALDGSFGGAAAPPYPVTVGRTCGSAVASRPPAQRRWRSAPMVPEFASLTDYRDPACECRLPPHPSPLPQGEGVRAGGALQSHHRVERVVRGHFPLPKGEGSRVRGKGACDVPTVPIIFEWRPQSCFSFCLQTGRRKCRPSEYGLL
jgi:hypothetical protein